MSAPRLGSVNFSLYGIFEARRAVIKYESLFKDGKIQYGDHNCLGEITLTGGENKDEDEVAYEDYEEREVEKVEDDDPLEAKLEKLKKLLEKGLITEEEAAATLVQATVGRPALRRGQQLAARANEHNTGHRKPI